MTAMVAGRTAAPAAARVGACALTLRVIARAGTGTEPLVIVVEAASELRAQELEPVLEAARHSRRPVILRIIGDG